MSSIAYAGHAFDDYVSAEIMEPVAHVVAPETATVPGRPGRVLLSADMEPLEFKVRLLMDSPDALTTAQRSEVRRTLRGGYSAPTVRFSGSPASRTSSGATWCARASLTGRRSSRRARPPSRSSRSTPSPTGRGSSTAASFEVGGTWSTWPVVEMAAVAGEDLEVALGDSFVRMSRALSEGDKVVIDMAAQTVTVEGQTPRAM